MGSKSISTAFAIAPPSPEEHEIKSLWVALQVAGKQLEKRGIAFGKACYEYRSKYAAPGRRTDLVTSVTRSETFEEFCDRIEIVRMTAYRWIARYETVLGERIAPTPTLATPEENWVDEPALVAPTTTIPMTTTERDNQQLRDFIYRLQSVTGALKTLVANDCSELLEYPNLVAAAHILAGIIKKL